METYRFGMAWRALGFTVVTVAIVLPLLMLANNEEVDVAVVLMSVGVALAGAWCYIHFASYKVTITDDGITLVRFGRRPAHLAWRDIVSVRTNEHEIAFRAADQRKIAISVHFPGYEAIEGAVARNLPDVAFPSPTARPPLPPEIRSAADLREYHHAKQRFWLRASRRCLLSATLLASAAFSAALATEHVPFRELPRAVAITLSYILAFARSWGYGMAIMLVVSSLLFAIMGLQEVLRARRVPPAG